MGIIGILVQTANDSGTTFRMAQYYFYRITFQFKAIEPSYFTNDSKHYYLCIETSDDK